MTAARPEVVAIGSGGGGLVPARLSSARSWTWGVLDTGNTPGDKLRAIEIAGRSIGVGPSVFTFRDVFEALFAGCGGELGDHLTLNRAERFAWRLWSGGARPNFFSRYRGQGRGNPGLRRGDRGGGTSRLDGLRNAQSCDT
ncbi:phytoene dehydrogenase-like protein [Rhodoblastus sphagnicola]|uniref:hypothetical protein n=1 Tax=Rhodoblastus sphagnicola TaxID=333368 RepID=UPI0011B09A03|nr:hypothetical protein [Rhodoblastus sphagnicola]MBB4196812.1 phytoene dehydrogenase-like protein [Rhodoblastus sphagnicola]